MKVTADHIESLVAKEEYWNNGKTTVCILTLDNGFEVIGTSGVVDRTKFDEELGKQIAKKRAVDKVWELEGYHYQYRLQAVEKPEVAISIDNTAEPSPSYEPFVVTSTNKDTQVVMIAGPSGKALEIDEYGNIKLFGKSITVDELVDVLKISSKS